MAPRTFDQKAFFLLSATRMLLRLGEIPQQAMGGD
jgi:hypothetical protein